MRKKIIGCSDVTPRPSGLDVSSIATVMVTSESEDHPVENAFDARRGPGGSYWMASEAGEQTIILEFDGPQAIRRVELEIEETEAARIQELTLSVSDDGAKHYRQILRQEYNFSPSGTTFQREEWQLNAERLTHLRLQIKPDKGGGPTRAKLTSLVVH